MANDVVKLPLSASVQGQGIKVAATATAGTLIHTTGTSATVIDEIWLYAFNSHSADVLLTIEFGGPTAPDQNIVLTIPFKAGLVLVIPGLMLQGSGSVALTVKAFAATTNVIVISGHVFRVTP